MPLSITDKIKNKTVAPEKLILLIAAIERRSKLYSLVNFDEMAAQSGYEYSATSLEHTFREYKMAAQKLNKEKSVDGMVSPKKRKAKELNAEDGDDEASSPVKPRTKTPAVKKVRMEGSAKETKKVVVKKEVENGDEE